MKILDVAKAALFGIFLNYYCYFALTGSFIPMGTVIFFGVACLCVVADAVQQRYVHVGKEIRCWLLYAVVAFATTALMNQGTGYIGDVLKYVQRVMIIMMVAYICEREHSVRFGLQLMAVTAITLAISIIAMTDDIQLKLSLTSGADLSANDTGSIMAYGCFAIAFAWGRKGHTSMGLSAAKMAAMICCLIVIFLSGSRKSIIAVAIMLVLMALMCFPDYRKNANLRKLFVLAVIIGAAALFITRRLLPQVELTNLYARLFGRGAESAGESDEIRMRLLVYALDDFANHPLFGLGFNQFRKLHGNYTHSTYFEPLACSGLMGLLYLYPYYSMVKKQIQLIRAGTRGSYGRLKQKELFAYLCVGLFIAVGIPFMYKDIPCILLGTIIASQTISFEELRKEGVTSAEY